MAPSFSQTFPGIIPDIDSEIKKDLPKKKKKKIRGMSCLIPCAIDQDPYFRLTRDIANRLGFRKPSTIYSKFFPGLKGPGSKMSTSNPTSAIFLSDTKNQIKKRINKFAFSGGGSTVEEHRKNGANISVDVPFKYLTFFLDDDEKLEDIRVKYSKGELLSGEVKKELILLLQKMMKEFQDRRIKVTDEVLKKFCSIRILKLF